MKKTMFRKVGTFAVVAAMASSVSGCMFGGDRIMISESYLDENYVKNIVVRGSSAASGDATIQLWNWVVRVCDINKDDATATDCVDTTVIDNVENYRAVR